MAGRGLVQSPVLIGRDDFVALARQRMAQAAAGAGQLLFVAGEAGIGKTRLLVAVERSALAAGFEVVAQYATPVGLGPIVQRMPVPVRDQICTARDHLVRGQTQLSGIRGRPGVPGTDRRRVCFGDQES